MKAGLEGGGILNGGNICNPVVESGRTNWVEGILVKLVYIYNKAHNKLIIQKTYLIFFSKRKPPYPENGIGRLIL